MNCFATVDAMSESHDRRLYLPRKDRSFWKVEPENKFALSYLAWGQRDFSKEFLPECYHDGWVGTIIEEGNATMIIGGNPVRLPSRQFIIIGPDCSFGWSSESGNSCKFMQWMWQEFNEDEVDVCSRDSYYTNTLVRGKLQPFKELLIQCRREVLNLSSSSQKYLHGCQLMFETLVQRVSDTQTPDDVAESRVRQSHEWMIQHLDSKEPIVRLCDFLGTSQSTLHRLFKSTVDKSPAAYFQELRMTEAKRLLSEGNCQVKEVAFVLGYKHFNDFSRAYKTHYGMSPRGHADAG